MKDSRVTNEVKKDVVKATPKTEQCSGHGLSLVDDMASAKSLAVARRIDSFLEKCVIPGRLSVAHGCSGQKLH